MLLSGCSFFGDAVGGDAAHGQVVAKARCAACHANDGNSTVPTYPRLAGQRARYLYRQLSTFRDGTRPSTVMATIVAPLSDGDLRDVATFFAGQPRGSDPAGPPALMAQGRRLFLYGSSDGRVPACAACHAAGTGMMGRMGSGHMSMMGMMTGRRAPSLYGQHAVYVVGQLKAFADGTRPAMMMSRVAGAMTVQQAQAVADYVAAHQ
nr:c-type cytochrome [Oleiagrimonas sp. C23AA]